MNIFKSSFVKISPAPLTHFHARHDFSSPPTDVTFGSAPVFTIHIPYSIQNLNFVGVYLL